MQVHSCYRPNCFWWKKQNCNKKILNFQADIESIYTSKKFGLSIQILKRYDTISRSTSHRSMVLQNYHFRNTREWKFYHMRHIHFLFFYWIFCQQNLNFKLHKDISWPSWKIFLSFVRLLKAWTYSYKYFGFSAVYDVSLWHVKLCIY